VSIFGAVCLWGVPELVIATKFRDIDKETSFGTAYELFRAIAQRGALISQAFVFDAPPNRSLKECGYEHFVADARNKLPLIGAGGARILEEAVRLLGTRASPRQPSARS
jgi:hypothetical protein